MLTIDLARLERERGPVHIREAVPADAPLFADTDLALETDLTVEATVSLLPSGEVVVRGTFSGSLSRECRRCLDPVTVPLEEEIDLLFVPEDELAQEADEDDDVRRFNLASGTLELGRAVREEAILAAPLYVECDPECRGLCPSCGVNRNEEDCDCTLKEPDERWDALRALKEE